MDGILRLGRVLHGYLGIDRALTEGPGVMVNRVVKGSPAERAAIQPGDVIRKFNGRTVNDIDDLRRGIAAVDIDATVPVEVLRNGATVSVKARIAEEPPAMQLTQKAHYPHGQRFLPGPGKGSVPAGSGVLDGVQTRELTADDRHKLDLPDATKGMLVTGVGADAAAAEKLRPGDVIAQVGQEAVGTAGEYAQRVNQLPDDEAVIVTIIREHNPMVVVIHPG